MFPVCALLFFEFSAVGKSYAIYRRACTSNVGFFSVRVAQRPYSSVVVRLWGHFCVQNNNRGVGTRGSDKFNTVACPNGSIKTNVIHRYCGQYLVELA